MKNIKELRDKYVEDLQFDVFKTEIAIEENKIRAENYKKEEDKLSEEITKKTKALEESKQGKKTAQTKELREQHKGMVVILDSQLKQLEDKSIGISQRYQTCINNIKMYEDFLNAAAISIDLANKKIENKV